jgi:hypothetical protein
MLSTSKPALPELPFVLAYTNISHYLNCPKRMWHQHIRKDIPAEIKTYAQRSGSSAHDHLKKRLKIREPLPREHGHHESICAKLEGHDSIKHMELELGVDAEGKACGFFDDRVRLRGKLDLACTNSPHALLIDWKTGKPWEDALELRVQSILLRARYPDLTHFTGFYYWLKTGAVGRVHDLDPDAAWLSVFDIATAMAGRLQRSDWPADENALCPWCPVPKGVMKLPLEPVCPHRRDPPQR